MRRVWLLNRFGHPDISAASVLMSDLALGLADRFDVRILAGSRSYAADPASDHAGDLAGVEIVRLPRRVSGATRVGAYAEYLHGARSLLTKRLGPDDAVVCLTDPPMLGAWMAGCVGARGARLLQWWQDVFPDIAAAMLPAGGPALRRAGRAWQRRRLTGARHVAISPTMAARLSHWLGAQDISVIENWMPGQRTDPASADGAAIRADLGVGGRTLLMYCGNLGRVHDDAAVLALARAVSDSDRFALCVVGGGSGWARLQHAVASGGLRNVTVRGYVADADLGQWLRAADVHVVSLKPSMEGLSYPSKLYPILAASRPVLFVGSPASEVARRLVDAEAGWAPPDAAAWLTAAGVHELAPRALATRGHNARVLFDALDLRGHAIAAWTRLLNNE